ncbi:hypothetical protein BDY24DRAFT_394400 [Mrakia frigida]|uniref:uncharacterized protein n=1 Tax=Mrakia frigida TaxID=29902 RepID=UPI003FCBEED3
MVKGIEKQMKWQPSCKTGRTKWNYSAVVPSEAVFLEVFNLVPEKKQWKVKKIPKDTFENLTGSIYASIRYGSLQITSPDITLKWNKEDLTYTVSGLYGL